MKMRCAGGLLGVGTGGNVDLRAGAAALPLHAHPQPCVAVGSGPGPQVAGAAWGGYRKEGKPSGSNFLPSLYEAMG